MNEPVYVDDKSGVDFFAYTPDPKSLMDSSANGTKPVLGLEKTVRVIVSAGNKNQTFDLEPDFNGPRTLQCAFVLSYSTNNIFLYTQGNIE